MFFGLAPYILMQCLGNICHLLIIHRLVYILLYILPAQQYHTVRLQIVRKKSVLCLIWDPETLQNDFRHWKCLDINWTKNHDNKRDVERSWTSRNKETKLSFYRTERSWTKQRVTRKVVVFNFLSMIPNKSDSAYSLNGSLCDSARVEQIVLFKHEYTLYSVQNNTILFS